MLQMNLVRFEEVTNEAILRARQAPQDAKRWERAIVKACEFLSSTGLWHLMGDGETLLIVSPQSGHIYQIGEACEVIDGERSYPCAAFDRGMPCWHRAAKRLVELYVA
jgi:hypothetical protein